MRQTTACRNLSKNEIEGHAIHLKECLAVLFGLQCFDGFLRDKPFIIRTDSRAITFMNKNEIMSSKLARWAVIIQSYPYTLEHVPAEQNGGPDSLSRLPTYEDKPNAAEELEEFLDRKILKVASRERRKNAQKATITFEDGNSGSLYEGETEREHQGFSTNELADLGNRIKSTSGEDGLGYIKRHPGNTREGGLIPATERRCRFQRHDPIQRNRRTPTSRVASEKDSIHRRHVCD